MTAVKTGNSRQLSVIFLAVLVPAAATLVWLGWTLLDQDRILFRQREQEQQEAAADGVARALLALLADAEQKVERAGVFDGLAMVSRGPAGPTFSGFVAAADGSVAFFQRETPSPKPRQIWMLENVLTTAPKKARLRP